MVERPTCVVYGNCQGHAVARLLATSPAFAAAYELVPIPQVHEVRPEGVAALQQVFDAAGLVVTQAIRADYQGLPIGSEELLATRRPDRRVIRIPALFDGGTYPYQVYVRPSDGVPAPAPRVVYHDLRLLAFSAAGYDADAALAALASWTPSPAGLRAIAAAAVAANREREAASDIAVVDALMAPEHVAHAFFTINHPGDPALEAMARAVLAALGLPEELDTGLRILESVATPVDPVVLEALGVDLAHAPLRRDWVLDGAVLTPAQLAAEHLADYAEHPGVAASGVEQHAERIAQLGLDRLAAPKPRPRPRPSGPARVLVLADAPVPAPLEALESVRTRDAFAPPGGRWELAVAADWRAAAHLFAVDADRYALWVDELAHHRLGAWQAERIAAALAYDLPVDFLAAGSWIAAELRALRPDARVLEVVPGLAAGPPSAPVAGPLRVLVDETDALEGEASAAAAVLAGLAEPHVATTLDPARLADQLAGADVLLRLRPLGGLLGPALRAAGAGVVPLLPPGAGAEDLVAHLEDGIVLEPDDPRGTARWLEHLARDRELLARLRAGALARTAAWPSPEAAAATLQAALEQLVAEPAPEAARWPKRLMADALAGVALYRADFFIAAGELERLQADETYLTAQAVRRRLDDPRLDPVRRLAQPLVRAAKRRLGA